MEISKTNYLSVFEASRLYGWPIGGLRGLLFYRRDNGLERAVIRVGRKLLIKRTEFESWLEEQRESSHCVYRTKPTKGDAK